MIAAVGVAVYFATTDEGGSESTQTAKSPAPEVVVREVPAPDQQADGPRASRRSRPRTPPGSRAPTRSPTPPRSALAVFPSAGDAAGPDAVTLVDAGDWPAGIAAASLVAAPIGAPVLITDGGEVPDAHRVARSTS